MDAQIQNAPANELRSKLGDFAAWRSSALRGDEKGEAQVFLDRFFSALGYGGVFEAGATLEFRLSNDSGGTSFADLLWKPRVLIEMKKAGTNLQRHFRQAFDYWAHAVPDRPRYVVLCNFDEFWIYDFEVQIDEPVERVMLRDLSQRWETFGFLLPQEVRPVFNNDLVAVTRDAAAEVAKVFMSLKSRGIDPAQAQRFVLQCVMAMFAEDVGLLPRHSFTAALTDADTGAEAYDLIGGLFREMNTPGSTSGGRYVGTPYFNGGLFAEIAAQELNGEELDLLRRAAMTKWSDVRPEIFGTLFEGSMDQGERHASGAHFTSQADIARIVGPVVVQPWQARIDSATSIPALNAILEEMSQFRVLDPSCGSGNFLYIAYRELRRLEWEVLEKIRDRRRSENLALMQPFQYVSPEQFFGIDVNPFAVEVAKVTMLLGKKLSDDELGLMDSTLPLNNLDGVITTGDALFEDWPCADAIIGNPPYIGRRKMVRELGADYCARLDERYGRQGVSDFVTYWFPKAHDHLPVGGRAGFVGTKSIKQGDGRRASLDYIVDNDGVIFDAVASMPWSGEAAVTVSIVNWQKGGALPSNRTLWIDNGSEPLQLAAITAALSPEVNLRTALPLQVNAGGVYQGQTFGVAGAFKIDNETAHRLLNKDEGARDAIFPILGGDELIKQTALADWVIDIPSRDADEAWTRYPSIMALLEQKALPIRRLAAQREAEANEIALTRNPNARVNWHHRAFLNRWWTLGYRREDLLDATTGLPRYIALTRVSSELRGPVFAFVDGSVRIADSAVAFPFSDDYSFAILQSIVHEIWFRERCTTLETRLTYTSGTVYRSFPWPQSPTQEAVDAVTIAARALIEHCSEAFDRGHSLAQQFDVLRREGTSTLRRLKANLDTEVVRAYGFDQDEDLLPQILELNLMVAQRESSMEPVTAPGSQATTIPSSMWAWPAPQP